MWLECWLDKLQTHVQDLSAAVGQGELLSFAPSYRFYRLTELEAGVEFDRFGPDCVYR